MLFVNCPGFSEKQGLYISSLHTHLRVLLKDIQSNYPWEHFKETRMSAALSSSPAHGVGAWLHCGVLYSSQPRLSWVETRALSSSKAWHWASMQKCLHVPSLESPGFLFRVCLLLSLAVSSLGFLFSQRQHITTEARAESARAGHMVDIKNDCVHLAERKGLEKPLGQAEMGFPFSTMLCEECRCFSPCKARQLEGNSSTLNLFAEGS